ncbi:biotin/lipoyl-containing protein [Edaphobacter modestus]|uniref:biotin/lipoyl-containing protein n=1 Tax=Edaphobacter modestus TaxID=388466 RepID=UPI00102C6475|nr:biotin/lipoyl-containing protein [Edaphobacter modestus]
MPFVYEVMLAEESPQPSYKLAQQLVPAGTLVGTGQNIAILSDGKSEFHLRAPLQGLLVEWFAASGDPLDADETIARIVAEGSEQLVSDATPVRINPC